MKAAAGQMSVLPRQVQMSRIESSCASDTLAAQNAEKTREERHSWQVDILRAEEGLDLAGEGAGVQQGARAQVSCSGDHMDHPGGAGGALGSEGRGGIPGRASVAGCLRVVGLAHGLDGCRRTVGMADEPRHAHRLHARAAHEAPLEVCGSWVAVKTVSSGREEGGEYQGSSGGWSQAHSFFIYFCFLFFGGSSACCGEGGSSRGEMYRKEAI